MRPYVQFVDSDGSVSEIYRIVEDGTLIAITSKQAAKLKVQPFRIDNVGNYTGIRCVHILFASLVSDAIPWPVLFENKNIGVIFRPSDPQLKDIHKLIKEQSNIGNKMIRFFFTVVRSKSFYLG